MFDFTLASALLILFLPLLTLAAIGVALTSSGPVIFSQDRIGYAGRRFRIHKFRTMVKDAEQRRDELKSASLYDDERVFKVRNDPRVTPFGRILRRTSVDELPQVLNVIKGEMSLVGPRPPLPFEVEKYEDRHFARKDFVVLLKTIPAVLSMRGAV